MDRGRYVDRLDAGRDELAAADVGVTAAPVETVAAAVAVAGTVGTAVGAAEEILTLG